MISNSPEETFHFGEAIASKAVPGTIFALSGDLGAGKTTFLKGMVSSYTGINPDEIHSPTFTYLQIYEGKTPFYHFDLYRLEGVDPFLQKGFSDFLDKSGVCAIEWPNRITPLLQEKNTLWIEITQLGMNRRKIDVRKS